MSNREENDYDRQFQADLQKAIALSLETSEYEKLRNEHLKKYSELSDSNLNSRKNSVTNFSRPRPESTVKLNSTLLPPPSTSKKNNTSTNDLISFHSPKDETKENVNFNLCIFEFLKD